MTVPASRTRPSPRRSRPRPFPHRLRRDPLVRAVAALDPDPWRAALAVLLGVGALACAIGLTATSAWLISRAAQRPPVLYLQIAVVATRAFGIGRGVLRYGERLAGHDVALRGVVAVRERLYRSLAAAEPSVVASLRRGELLSRVGADVDTLADLVVRSLLPFAVAVVTAAGSSLLVLAILPVGGLPVVVCLLLAAVLAPWLAVVSARRSQRAADRTRDLAASEVMSLLDHLPELTVWGRCPSRLERLRELDEARFREVDRAAAPQALASALNVLLTGTAVIAALVLGTRAVREGILDPVLLAVVTLTPLATAEAISGLPAAAVGLVRCRAAAERILPLLEAPPARTGAAVPAGPAASAGPAGPVGPEESRGLSPRPGWPLIAEDLRCAWPGGPAVLEGMDLRLGPGSRVAVVGASGCGKTTLLLTLAGLLPPRGGRVSLDGAALADLDPVQLRRTVNLTAEDAHVFRTTVRENLRVAAPEEPGDDHLLAALRRAGLGPWAGGLPDGLDTVLGPDGTGLSGGERRRLLLARAFLVRARVLLLDEPAEHLDPGTADSLVRDVLAGSPRPGSTPQDPVTGEARQPDADRPGPRAPDPDRCPAVVVVTHRITPLEAADEVVVLAGGGVAARGSHAWLLENHPPYRDLLLAERYVTRRAVTDPRGSAARGSAR